MADVTVKFLGENYSFPEELKDYVSYCNEFEKINKRLSQALLVTMNRPTITGGETSQAGEVETKLKEDMRKEGKKVISMLAKYNIFDVTESDLVDNNKGYIYYNDVYQNIMMRGLRLNLAEELQNFLDDWEDAQQSAYSQVTGTGISMYSNSMIAHMTLAAFETSTIKKQCEQADRDYKRAMLRLNLAEELQNFLDDWEDAQQSAYSQVTGTGISMYSNSMIAHMTLAAFETSTIKKQCEQADRDYKRAMDALSARGTSVTEKKNAEVMIKTFAEIANAFGMFISELMDTFLNKLQQNNIFDYSKTKEYDIKRSSEILNNMSLVEDKKSVLIQAFKSCPYNPDIYAKVLEMGLCDLDTFKTAQYYYQDEVLTEVLDDYVKKNLKNTEKVTVPISILATYRGTDEIGIWKKIYEGTLENIEGSYKIINTALSDKKKLDRFIRDNISSSMKEVVKKSREDVIKNIDKKMLALVSEKQYDEFVGMGILSPEIIRMSGSSATTLNDINGEIRNALTDCVMEYIEEAKKRYDAYDKAMDIYEKELKQKYDELNVLRSEKNSLGLFAFSKKKEMTATIDAKVNEISEFKRTHEPKDLLAQFEAMYR